MAPADEDMAAVTAWLDHHGMQYTLNGFSSLEVTSTAAAAAAMLNTVFHVAEHDAERYKVVRAGDYAVPAEVEGSVATIFGLHGLPLPRAAGAAVRAPPGAPASVTPSTIYSTYKVTAPKVTRSTKNRQAVAEFQGQFMNDTDLAGMFAKYVTNYEKGTDDKVCLLYTSPSPRDQRGSRMPSSA